MDRPATRGSRPAAADADARAAPELDVHADAGRAVARSLATLRPMVTESIDGLTLVILGREERPAGQQAEVADAFTLPAGAVGVAVGLFDRLVSVESFGDADALADAWRGIVHRAAAAWIEERVAIEEHRVPLPGRLRPDDGAAARLLRRATIAVAAGPNGAGPEAAPEAHDPAVVHPGAARPLGAGGPDAPAAAWLLAPGAPDAPTAGDRDLIVPIHGERVEGSARVVDGRVVHLELHRRERPDPPDGLVP